MYKMVSVPVETCLIQEENLISRREIYISPAEMAIPRAEMYISAAKIKFIP